jgi:hypothetical protein
LRRTLVTGHRGLPGRAAVAAALASALLVAGCGSSGGSNATPPTTTPNATTPIVTTPAGSGAKAPVHATAAEVAKCREVVAARAGLSASVKAQLDVLCKKASSESPVEVREAAAEVCETLVMNSGLPAGTDRSEALAACKTA